MINLILAILSSACVSLALRHSGGRIQSKAAMFAVNYLFCLALSAAYTMPGRAAVSAAVSGRGTAIALGAVNGSLYLANFLLLEWVMRRSGVVLAAVFAKLGVVVSTLLSILLFRELPGPAQACGGVLAVAAIVLLNWQTGAGEKLDLLPLALMLLAGVTDLISKIYAQVGSPVYADEYLLYTFGTAFLLSLLLVVVKKQRFSRAELLFGVLVGQPNYYSARFLLGALSALPAVVVYPVYSVGTILVVTAAGVMFYRETLTRRQLAGGGIILAALVLLNL